AVRALFIFKRPLETGQSLLAGRTHRSRQVIGRALFKHIGSASGLVVAHNISPTQRLGLYSSGSKSAVWRKLYVGRLSCEGAGPLPASNYLQRTLLCIF